MIVKQSEVQKILNRAVVKFNRRDFIEHDPISIPHQFTKKQDIEIAGFFAAIFSWGQRKTIINKTNELMERMDRAPLQFILHHNDRDLKNLLGFVHRTFNDTDLLYCIAFFKEHYSQSDTMEELFITKGNKKSDHIQSGLEKFHNSFFSLDYAPQRTRKHIANPATNSTCKRLCMFMRWMVRDDKQGVDFGLWKRFKPSQLLCPLDVHVDRVGRELGLIERKQTDWQTVLELTKALKQYDRNDPVKYDFALFGLGIEKGNK